MMAATPGPLDLLGITGPVEVQDMAATQLIFAELDFQAVLTARYHLPTLRDSNLDLIHRELGRLTWQVGVPPESRRV